MESFPTYLRSVRYMDDILRSIKGGPVWSLEGKESPQIKASDYRLTPASFFTCKSGDESGLSRGILPASRYCRPSGAG